jgi:two-component system, chemotaxis family, protein-glutamate methylesterase/glutaminase
MLEDLSPWVIAIGASGSEGLDDLRSLLAEWQEINAIVMIVLHRPWEKDTHLRQILQRSTHMPVQIADQGQQLRAGCIYIGEPSRLLCLLSDSISILISDPKRAHRNRTVDLLFNSLGVLGGQRTIGIVLSGSLDDGSRGLAEIMMREATQWFSGGKNSFGPACRRMRGHTMVLSMSWAMFLQSPTR